MQCNVRHRAIRSNTFGPTSTQPSDLPCGSKIFYNYNSCFRSCAVERVVKHLKLKIVLMQTQHRHFKCKNLIFFTTDAQISLELTHIFVEGAQKASKKTRRIYLYRIRIRSFNRLG